MYNRLGYVFPSRYRQAEVRKRAKQRAIAKLFDMEIDRAMRQEREWTDAEPTLIEPRVAIEKIMRYCVEMRERDLMPDEIARCFDQVFEWR
jgi:hypothetical protein